MLGSEPMDIDTRLYRAQAQGVNISVLNVHFSIGSVSVKFFLAWPSEALSSLGAVAARAGLMQVVETHLPEWLCAVSKVPSVDANNPGSNVSHASIMLMPKNMKGYGAKQQLVEGINNTRDGCEPQRATLKKVLDAYWHSISAEGPKDDAELVGTANSRCISAHCDRYPNKLGQWAALVAEAEAQVEVLAIRSTIRDAGARVKSAVARV
jgi:hypothetical protein